jgi:hypothetical protein
MKGLPVTVLTVLAVLVAAAPAAAAGPTVAYARCDRDQTTRDVAPARTRMGPFLFNASWDDYAEWVGMERMRNPEDGTFYAKSPLYVRRDTIGSLAVAPAYRDVADFVYGRGPDGSHALSDVVRFHSCKRSASFFSGGLVVGGPTCVGIEARVRGSRRVYRRMVSVNMGANCPAR